MHRSKSFYVGQFKVEPQLNQISCDEQCIQLVPKVMALLLVLVEHHGEPLSQDRLIELVWPGQVVTDSSVYQAVAQLRKALGDSGSKKTFIERVSGKGYRLIAPIKEDETIVESAVGVKRPWWLSVSVIAVPVLIALIVVWWFSRPQQPAENALAIDNISSITLVDLQTESPAQLAKLDALTHVLLTQLTDIQGMKVVHHQSVSKQIDTQVVMSGKVNREGENVRVYLQMQRPLSGEVIWAKLFAGQIDNLFGLQDNIVEDLLTLFKRQKQSQPFDSKQVDQQSFDQYMLAHHLWNQREVPQLQQAQGIYETMQQEQRLFPLAAVGLCNTYHFLHIYGDWLLSKALDKCQPLLEQALLDQPELGQALAAKAMLLSSQGQQLEATSLFKVALKQAPNYAFGYMWYGNLVRDMGHYEQALEMTQKAYQLSPMSPIINRSLAYSHLNLSQMKQARHYFERALALEPHYSHRPVSELEFLPLTVTRAKAFIQWTQKNANLMPRRPYESMTLAQIKLAVGDVESAAQMVQSQDYKRINPGFKLYMEASVLAANGDLSGALEVLKQRMLPHRDTNRFVMPYLAVLSHQGQYELVYQHFAEFKPDWLKNQSTITADNQYLISFYIRLQYRRNKQAEVAELAEKLDAWFVTNNSPPDYYQAIWQVFRGQNETAKATLLSLMKDGWLPDFNEEILAEQGMRRLFVDSGLGADLFDRLLAENRGMVGL